ncbi:MAG TPA: hypothetical protein VE964_03075 [Myxococcales bacterium]|nr:hypothetical protein [Myxococcales bacterium]
MGRWDFLADQKPQELKEYVLDRVADRLAADLRAWPPAVDEWLDESARQRFRAAVERPSAPGLPTLRVACELARQEMLREYELIDGFWRSGAHRELLPDELEETTAHFVTRYLVDAALAFQELAKGKFARKDLLALLERVEDRLLQGHRFRL